MHGLQARIIGAGVIGLSLAWALARMGAKVSVHDQHVPGRGASWASAGLLAPAFEAFADAHGPVRPELVRLCLAAHAGWHRFATGLRMTVGRDFGLSNRPALAVATNVQERAMLEKLLDGARTAGLAPRCIGEADRPSWLTRRPDELLELPSDHQVDNRVLLRALWRACARDGVTALEQFWQADRRSNLEPEADIVVIAAGHWLGHESSGLLAGVNGLARHIQPIKGQMLSLERGTGKSPDRVVRQASLYIAPKSDRIVVGASLEPGARDLSLTHDTLEDLLARAVRLVPSLGALAVRERWAGIRPGISDGLPLVGQIKQRPGHWLAVGHYRNGVLLAPLTAEIVASQIMSHFGRTSAWAEAASGRLDALAAPMSPQRLVDLPGPYSDQ